MSNESKSNLKRMPVGSVSLAFAGELILPKCDDKELSGLFKRYQVLFEHFANMDKEERILNYRMLCGLILTSHAKKIKSPEQKKTLFDLKNELYLSIANHMKLRRKVAFRYLVSKNFCVVAYCSSCTKRQEKENVPRHEWKYCKNCKVDRSFYNVLSMYHKFTKGYGCMFLSNDQMPQIKGIKVKQKGKLDGAMEEARYDKYQYNVRNLDAIALESALKMFKKVLELDV